MKTFIILSMFFTALFTSPVQAGYNDELIEAASRGPVNSVKELLRKGANPNAKDDSGKTALHRTIQYNADGAGEYYGDGPGHRLEITKLLLRAGARINEVDRQGLNALTLSIGNRENPDVALYLIERGIKIQSENKSLLIYTIDAAMFEPGFIAVADKLIDRKINLFEEGFDDSPLTAAMRSESFIHLAIRLLDLGANPNTGSDYCCSGPSLFQFAPIMKAAQFNNPTAVKELIKRGANINLQFLSSDFKRDRSALMFAAEDGYIEVVKVLLAANADKNLKNMKNETAYDLAVKNGHYEVADLLKP